MAYSHAIQLSADIPGRQNNDYRPTMTCHVAQPLAVSHCILDVM